MAVRRSKQAEQRSLTPAQAVAAGVPEGHPYRTPDGRVLIARRAPAARAKAAGGGLLATLAVLVLVRRALRSG